MNFLDKLYSSNYFGIGLFAVIAFLVVAFLIVLFFGKKDEKKRKLEETQKLEANDTFKETSKSTPVEIPINPEPVAPINLDVEPVKTGIEPNVVTPIEPITPVTPVPPVNESNDLNQHDNNENEFVENLRIEEPVINTPKIEPVPIIKEEPVHSEVEKVELDQPKIPINDSPVHNVVEPVIKPIINEETPKLQINEEPVINTYYNPTKKLETEKIKVPNIDFDALAKSISKELDELEKDSKKYEEITVTPINEITEKSPVKKPETFSSVYVREPIREVPKEKIELPKKIDLPARKSE